MLRRLLGNNKLPYWLIYDIGNLQTFNNITFKCHRELKTMFVLHDFLGLKITN